MCPHDRFEILVYENGIMVRKCKDCGRLEIKTECWAELSEVADILKSFQKEDDDK